MKYLILLLSVGVFSSSVAQRYVLSLNGSWEVEESIEPDDIPFKFTHRGPVPGMANLCKPAFENVDAFDGIDYLNNEWIKTFIKNIPTDSIRVGIFLTGNFDNVRTGDLFSDIKSLEIHEPYLKYLTEAFKPLGVYINFSKNTIPAGMEAKIPVMMINDEYDDQGGQLKLILCNEAGDVVWSDAQKFRVISMGQHTYEFLLRVPVLSGKYHLTAVAVPDDGQDSTRSLRKVEILNDW